MTDSVYQPGKARATLATCGSAHVLHDGLHDSLYVLLPLWSQAFGLSLVQVGLLKAVYSGAIALFQVPAGMLAERFGERRLLAAGTVLTGLGYLLLGTAGGFAALALLLALVGAGAGTQHPLSSTMVARAYAGGPRRAALGIYNFSGDLGKMAFPAAAAIAAAAIGWRGTTTAYGAIAVLAGLAIWAALARLGAGGAALRRAGSAKKAAGWGIRNRLGFRAISAINVIDTAAIFGFLTFLPFLLIEKGAAMATVGLALALTFAGGAAGKFLCGILAERLGIIRTAVITVIAKGLGILVLPALPVAAALVLLPLVGAALNGTSSVLYATVAEFVDADRHARAFGLFYTLGIGAGAAAPPLFGLLSDRAGVTAALAVIGLGVLLAVPLCLVLRRSLGDERAG